MKSYMYVLCLMTILSVPMAAQNNSSIKGKINDAQSGETIPFANIVLNSIPSLKLYDAVTADSSGSFSFLHVPAGNYRLSIHMIGYKDFNREIELLPDFIFDAGTISLQQDVISLGETVVSAERIKGRSEKDKTTFFITGKMAEVSGNGLDIIKMIPGIQVSLRNNVSLEGSQNILLLVDGKERDKDFLSQIPPDMIDKVEIMSTTPAKYDANVTGVVNVILKKQSGINGQVIPEIPVSGSVYSHPEYNLNVVFKKLTFFTSYNGELIRFDQQELLERNISSVDGDFETNSSQNVEQRLISGRFHYGLEYSSEKRWQAGFYGYYDIFSQKYNGSAETPADLKNSKSWQALRSSSDLNRSGFNTSFFKYSLGEKGSTLEAELGQYHFARHSADTYTPISTGQGSINNESLPILNSITFKTDLNIVLGQSSTLSAGIKTRSQRMEDVRAPGFNFAENTYAAYSSVGVNRPAYDWTFGLRLEKFTSGLENIFDNTYITLLPSGTLNLKLKKDRSLKIAAGRSISRPNLYHLNPVLSFDDPFTVRCGNPMLKPELRTSTFLEYSMKTGSNFLSARLFFNQSSDVISNLTLVNDTSVFETRIYNLGTIRQTGLQFTGTLKAGRMFNFVPYMRIYDNYCKVNRLSQSYISDRNQIVFESGLSAIAAFKHDINLALNFQYGSPRNTIQSNAFSDALYFISAEKTFKKSVKASIVSVLPFNRRFTYQGSESGGPGFSSRYTGVVLVRNFLMTFKVSYQFSYGRKAGKTDHKVDETVELPNKK